jgi:hypothetical protein
MTTVALISAITTQGLAAGELHFYLEISYKGFGFSR